MSGILFLFSFCLSCLTNIDLLFSYQKKEKEKEIKLDQENFEIQQAKEKQRKNTSYCNEKKNENEAQTSQCRSFTQILIHVTSDSHEKRKKK